MGETNGDSRTSSVMVAAIVVSGIVALACIVAFAAIYFFYFDHISYPNLS